MNDAEGFGMGRQFEKIEAQFDGSIEEGGELFFTKRIGAMLEHPEWNAGLRVPQAGCKISTFLVVNRHQRARTRIGGGAPDHGRIELGMIRPSPEMHPRSPPVRRIRWSIWNGVLGSASGAERGARSRLGTGCRAIVAVKRRALVRSKRTG